MEIKEKRILVEKFADIIQLMYDCDLINPDEFNELLLLADNLQYQRLRDYE